MHFLIKLYKTFKVVTLGLKNILTVINLYERLYKLNNIIADKFRFYKTFKYKVKQISGLWVWHQSILVKDAVKYILRIIFPRDIK